MKAVVLPSNDRLLSQFELLECALERLEGACREWHWLPFYLSLLLDIPMVVAVGQLGTRYLSVAAAAADIAGVAVASGKTTGGHGLGAIFGCCSERIPNYFVDLLVLKKLESCRW